MILVDYYDFLVRINYDDDDDLYFHLRLMYETLQVMRRQGNRRLSGYYQIMILCFLFFLLFPLPTNKDHQTPYGSGE